MNRLLCTIVVAIVTLGTSAQIAALQPDDSDARHLFELLNQARTEHGLKPLEWNDQLAAAALKHSQLMADAHKLSHEFPNEPKLLQRLADTGLRLDRSGENVAYDSTVQAAHEGLMVSPPHRANILNVNYNVVGIAVVSANHMLYVTEDFAHVMPQSSDADASKLIEAEFAKVRRKAGARPVPAKSNPRVEALACSMAQKDELITASGLSLPAARYAVAYTSTDPSRLPADVLRYRDARDVDSYSVGVCFARSPNYPAGVYWVLVVLFSPSRS